MATKQAYREYASGWTINIPREGFAPLLFLEWIESRKQDYRGRGYAKKTEIKARQATKDGYFRFEIVNDYGPETEEAVEYINANLPIN